MGRRPPRGGHGAWRGVMMSYVSASFEVAAASWQSCVIRCKVEPNVCPYKFCSAKYVAISDSSADGAPLCTATISAYDIGAAMASALAMAAPLAAAAGCCCWFSSPASRLASMNLGWFSAHAAHSLLPAGSPAPLGTDSTGATAGGLDVLY